MHSLGGNIPGWPNLDRSDKLGNCQKGTRGHVCVFWFFGGLVVVVVV